MVVSVVIPAYNAAGRIGRCLQALEVQTVARDTYEVIVVDDGSADDTASVAAAMGARVLRQENQGPGSARNYGAREARGEILVFTDDDCIAEPNFLEEIVRPIIQDTAIAGVQGRYRTRQTEFAARFIQAEIEERYDRMRRFDSINFIGTYAAAYRKDVFLKHGGFDTQYRQASGEDIDHSFKLAALGYRMVFRQEAVVHHTHPVTLAHVARVKFKRGYWHVRLAMNHPDRLVRNSYMPGSLPLQVASVPLLLISIAALPFSLLALLPILAIAGMFLWQSRFIMGTFLRNGYALTWATPLVSMLRAAALGAGMMRGLAAELARLIPGRRLASRQG